MSIAGGTKEFSRLAAAEEAGASAVELDPSCSRQGYGQRDRRGAEASLPRNASRSILVPSLL
ncbi:hypothetical protein [Hyperthermus butylicus]|uniref:hypothetical protein n=1 Tax=Hyperthermus butylicus TaxID=54248 RepID=UPI000322419D|nr:hypothetical protein [Hyperthermus butylicus]